MVTIRNNVFETNSSSCHSITFIKQKDLDELKNKEVVVVGIGLNIEENAKNTNEIHSGQLGTLEKVVDLFQSEIEKVKDISESEDDYYMDDFVKDMKLIFSKAWGVPLLRYIYFGKPLPEDFDPEIAELMKRYYFSDFIFFLNDWVGIYIESYMTLFRRDGEARVEYDKRRGLGKNPWRKISTIISC